jgi:hypothetical protein
MDCPTCGLTNPSEALKCDCGYNFQTVQSFDTPGWDIDLAWRQTVAAYWSISWPALIVSFAAVAYSLASFTSHYFAAAVAGQIAFFCLQAVLTPRLFRKNYRTFRIYAIRHDGQRSRRMSLLEILQVWLCIMGTELAFLTVTSILLFLYQNKLPAETIRSLSSLSLWLRFLLVGPYAVGLALRIRYPGFRLQATGLRYI